MLNPTPCFSYPESRLTQLLQHDDSPGKQIGKNSRQKHILKNKQK